MHQSKVLRGIVDLSMVKELKSFNGQGVELVQVCCGAAQEVYKRIWQEEQCAGLPFLPCGEHSLHQ